MMIKNKKLVAKKYQDDNVSKRYLSTRYNHSFFQLENEIQLKVINKYIKNNFIEIAPGVGRISSKIKPNITQGVLVEYSPSMIKELKKVTKFDIKHQDFFKFKASKKFNFGFSFRFIRHFDREDRDLIYKNIHSSLRDNSLFVFDVINKIWGGPSFYINKLWNKEIVYDAHHSLSKIKEELLKNGFGIKEIIPIYKIYPLERIIFILLKIINKKMAYKTIEFIDNLLGGFKWLAWEWIIVTRKK